MNLHNMIRLLIVILALQLHADGRRYVWTYEYQTLPRGEAEIESYSEFAHVSDSSGRQAFTTLQYEYEIGMNNQFDVGIYQKFTQSPASSLSYDGFKLRLRYKIGSKGKYILDPLLYLEYKDNPSFDHSVLETKLILARDFDKWNLALNPVMEIEFEEDELKLEFEYAAGFSYKLHPLLTLGLETKGDADTFFWGPTLSHGKDNLWFAIGLLTNGTAGGDYDRKLRFIIGLGL